MHYTIQMPGAVLGHSELPDRDPTLGAAAGPFIPTAEYARVEPIFRLFVAARAETAAQPTDEALLARYYAARDALQLELRDPSGRLIRTTSIHIGDYRAEAGDEALEVEVQIEDPAFWSRAAAVDD